MSKLNCLIVDDESIALDILEDYINRINELKLIQRCNNAIEAFNSLAKNQIDIVFLDIEMPQLSGTELAKSINPNTKIIFTTAYSNYAVESFELNAIDYLLKPISFERFLMAVNKVLKLKDLEQKANSESQSSENAFIYLKSDGMMTKIVLEEILFIESVRNCVHITTENKKIISYIPISEIEKRLPQSKFIRIHRSFIVSFSKIDAWSQNLIEIQNHKIPVGRNYKEIFSEKMEELRS